MCKWCGTRYCSECLRGEFEGFMPEPTKCRKCNQVWNINQINSLVNHLVQHLLTNTY